MGFELHGLTSNSPCDLLWLLGSKTATASYRQNMDHVLSGVLTWTIKEDPYCYVISNSLKIGSHLATRQLCQSKMLAHIVSVKRKASTLER